MMKTFLDDRLDIGFGIEWHCWGLGGNINIHGDLWMYLTKLGPLYFNVLHFKGGLGDDL